MTSSEAETNPLLIFKDYALRPTRASSAHLTGISLQLLAGSGQRVAGSGQRVGRCTISVTRLGLPRVIHRYTAIDRSEAIRPAFDWLRAVADDVFPIDMIDVDRALEIIVGKHGLSARDAIHAAVMERHSVERILSFDSGFDGVRGIERIYE